MKVNEGNCELDDDDEDEEEFLELEEVRNERVGVWIDNLLSSTEFKASSDFTVEGNPEVLTGIPNVVGL